MSRKPWVPLPHEADLFHNVYIDETSQTKHRFLAIGGLIVPLKHATTFHDGLLALRSGTVCHPTRPDGTSRIMKWEKVNAYNVQIYKRVVDYFFGFPKTQRLPVGDSADIHCVTVDTHALSLKDYGDGDADIGFNKHIYFLCAAMIAKRFPEALFHVYPDRRAAKSPLSEAQIIMNNGLKKYSDKRTYPIRRLRFDDPEQCQALQVVDIIIGALAYRLNGHYLAPKAKEAKKRLSDYILRKAKITDPFSTTPYYLKRFVLMHRPRKELPKPKEPPVVLHRL